MNLPSLESSFRFYLQNNRGLSLVSIKNYLSDYRQFVRWLEEQSAEYKFDPSKINHQTLENFKTYLLSRKIAKTTVKRKLATIRVFCQFCLNQQLLTVNPALELENPKQKSIFKTNLEQVSTKFSRWLKQDGASKNTIKNYLADIKNYLIWANEQ